MELEKYFFNLGEKPSIYFWRDKRGFEIDFLIEGKVLKIIEAKSGRTLSQDFFRNINYFKKITDEKIKSYLIYSGEDKQIRKETSVLSWRDIGQVLP